MPSDKSLPPPKGFLSYPDAQEVRSPKYQPRKDANPVLSGLPLVIASSLLTHSSFLAKIFYNNAGLQKIKDLPFLDEVPYTFHPLVIPLGDNARMIELGEAQLSPKNRGDAHHYTASDYHAMYKSGQVTPLQVAQTLLSLTSKYAKESCVYQDAWADSHGADQLALDAAKASTDRWAAGTPLGILDGVPIGVKDDLSVKGYIDHDGMAYKKGVAYFKPAEETVWPVHALQDAGAVVIGKNRMHELGSDTNGLNPLQGTPTNHLNNQYYPGGSSSGAGSSLGAGVIPIAVGTDAGGSVRFPAVYNGVYGLKPTHHRTLEMNSTMCVTGPMAANVADLTIAYRIMSQPDPKTSMQSKFAVSRPPAAGSKKYIGVDRAWWAASDPRVVAACDKALKHFTAQGYDLVDITIPYVDEAQTAHGGVTISEMTEAARRRGGDGTHWTSLIGPVNRLVLALGLETNAADLLKHNSMRTLLMRHMAWLFQTYPGLLVLTPTAPFLGWEKRPGHAKHGVSDGDKTFLSMIYVFLANMTGLPAVTAPVAFVEPDRGEGKVCVGMMATGEWGAEEALLAWAADAETYLHEVYPDGRRRPETWVDVLGLAAKQAV
ncbi:Amidase [Cordyceps fumosorosea ARSEF 2679]|uniref:Amidase n=1 Tax=Cordyceps fumosorosea (strain ARSEF 2679) TaxID=1081104 RepID=A0A167V0C5_CORFA|nr:Amidase [Cordyceps fumosorosea ARSEF 2679]OAA62088.1 Amidase [Cordyceps fumosorosea ARSEF 2679]